MATVRTVFTDTRVAKNYVTTYRRFLKTQTPRRLDLDGGGLANR
jgi:hypothetical protein